LLWSKCPLEHQFKPRVFPCKKFGNIEPVWCGFGLKDSRKFYSVHAMSMLCLVISLARPCQMTLGSIYLGFPGSWFLLCRLHRDSALQASMKITGIHAASGFLCTCIQNMSHWRNFGASGLMVSSKDQPESSSCCFCLLCPGSFYVLFS
jgi:hypothetical protein